MSQRDSMVPAPLMRGGPKWWGNLPKEPTHPVFPPFRIHETLHDEIEMLILLFSSNKMLKPDYFQI